MNINNLTMLQRALIYDLRKCLEECAEYAVFEDLVHGNPDVDVDVINQFCDLMQAVAKERFPMTLPLDPDKMNGARARWAEYAIDAFGRATDMDTDGEDRETMMGDLLCDLLHWCDHNFVNFDERLAAATSHYRKETGNE